MVFPVIVLELPFIFTVLVAAVNVPLFVQLPPRFMTLEDPLKVAPLLMVMLPLIVVEAASVFTLAPPLLKKRCP